MARPIYGATLGTNPFSVTPVFISACNQGSTTTLVNDVNGGANWSIANATWDSTNGLQCNGDGKRVDAPWSEFSSDHTLIALYKQIATDPTDATWLVGHTSGSAHWGDYEIRRQTDIYGRYGEAWDSVSHAAFSADEEYEVVYWSDTTNTNFRFQIDGQDSGWNIQGGAWGNQTTAGIGGATGAAGYHSNALLYFVALYDGVMSDADLATLLADPYALWTSALYTGTIDQSPTGIAKNTYVKIATVAPTDDTLTVTISAAGSAGSDVVVADNVGIVLAE